MARIINDMDRLLFQDPDSESYRLSYKKDWYLNRWMTQARNDAPNYDTSMFNPLPTLLYYAGLFGGTAVFAVFHLKTHKTLSPALTALGVSLFFKMYYEDLRLKQANAFLRANFHRIPEDVQAALRNFESDDMDRFLPEDYENQRRWSRRPIHFDI